MVDLEKISDSFSVVGHGLGRALRSLFGSQNARALRKMSSLVQKINAESAWAEDLSQEEMRAQTSTWQAGLKSGELKLDSLLPKAFAMVRVASVRTLGLRHYDVQLIGGMVLHQGNIAEMATGEGKTLVATLPAYLNGLAGKVYVVTVNDYLATRDANWMRPVFEYLGLSVGSIHSSMSPSERHPVYACDIIYGTNNEFGFDYLRDNMKSRLDDQVQRNLDFAIIDEVDSILVDEARTPLIISGPATGDAERYRVGVEAAKKLKNEAHFELKEKEKQAILSEGGIEEAQRILGVKDFYSNAADMEWPHVIETALRALHLYKPDVDYVVKDGDVVIVDEFTGRLMEGRRWSDGLHQSVEAKEGIRPRAQNQTLATITFQNYFRLFSKLSGMTGTAMTEAGEFASIYDLDVVAIPTNRPVVRADERDVIYLRMEDKWKAIASEIEEVHAKGQPVLVGTISIEVSELISGMLKRRGIPHEVLNAKQHDREAAIVSQAGRKGAVTVATNMAGRGTDIVLGGNPEKMLDDHCEQKGWTLESHAGEVKALEGQLQEQCATEKQEVLDAGGLYVLGTERHEARRIDNQLRGRSGRQGDPGRSRFFLSLDDDLMRRFYKDWVKNFLSRAGMGEGEPVESGMVSRAIEKAQRKVENYHFEIRKNLLEYDEVMDQQRHLIYGHRQEAVENADMQIPIQDMFSQVLDEQLNSFQGDGHDQVPDWEGCASWAQRKWGWEGDAGQLEAAGFDELEELFVADIEERMEARREEWGAEAMGELERFLVLNAIDQKWKDHLYAMDALRAGVGLRGYAQVDPKNEYKREGLVMFESMLGAVAEHVTDLILKVQMRAADDSALGGAWEDQQASHPSFAGPASQTRGPGNAPPRRVVGAGYQPQGGSAPQGNPLQEFARQQADQEAASQPRDSNSGAALPTKKPARNAPCPCGSGKKFKQCCGRGGA